MGFPSLTSVLAFLGRGEGDGEETDLEILRNALRAKEKEVESWKDNAQELEQRLKDSAIANSNSEAELRKLQREKSTLDGEHQETLTKYKGVVKRYENLDAEHKLLGIKCQKMDTRNRNQEREIEILRDTNLKISAESKTLVAQLNTLTGNIARQNQRVNTSAIRDDEYFTREFADLAKDIRNWSFAHFFLPSESIVPQAVTEALPDAIGQIAKGTNLPEIFKNRVTSRRVVAGLLANELRSQLFDPFMLGLLPEGFREFESMVEKTGHQKSPWLSQTISLFVKSERFGLGLDEKVGTLYKNLSEMLGGLAAQGSDESKRGQKLQAILERAANLAVEISQQPYWYHLQTVAPGDQFMPWCMEDVGREAWLEEDDPDTCVADCTVSLSVFPCVYREERIEGGNETEYIIINHAWVTVETGDDCAAIKQEDGDIVNKKADGGVKVEGGCSSGQGEDGGEMGAKGRQEMGTEGREEMGTEGREEMGAEGREEMGTEGREEMGTEGREEMGTEGREEMGTEGREESDTSPGVNMPDTEEGILLGLSPSESQEEVNQEAELDPARE